MSQAMAGLKPESLILNDFVDSALCICGKTFRAHMSGALYWPAENALIVADLHLEKGSHFARGGQMLPPYDTRETLRKLAQVIDYYDAATVITLGDSLHDEAALERMDAADRDTLAMILQDREWIWLTGNHDGAAAHSLGGTVLDELQVEGLAFRHEPKPGAQTHEIAGHLHPAARLVVHGTSLRRPCFVSNGLRLVVPAFGAFTGGLNILDDAFATLFGEDGLNVWMLGQEGCYPVAARLLKGD